MELIRAPLRVPTNQQGPEKVVYVDRGYTEDVYAHEFNRIHRACDWIKNESGWDLSNSSRPVYVFVYPGRYYSQITSWPNIRLIGLKGGAFKSAGVEIRGTGTTRDNYPLKAGPDYAYNLTNIDIKCTGTNGIITELGDCHFEDCLLKEGKFIENTTEAVNCNMSFKNVTMWGNSDDMIFNCTGTALNSRYISFSDCRLGDKMIFSSTYGAGTAYIEWNHTTLAGTHFELRGDWGIDLRDSYIYDNVDGSRNVLDTTGFWRFYNSNISNGFHIVKDTTGEKICHNVDFNDPDGLDIVGADITADVPIEIVDYIQNIQQNGNDGNLHIIDPVKPVGANAVNRYYSVQDAIDSVTTKGVIDLNASFTGLAELSIPTGVNITIDGHKLYSLGFTDNITTLNTNEQLVFYGLTELNGNKIEINGNSSYIGFEETLTANCYVVLTSGTGTYCLVYTSTIKAPSGYPAIKQDNINSVIVSGYSRIDGGVGHPAIRWTVDADNTFKCKFSTLLHGDGGANSPLDYTGAGKVDIAMYSSALNAAWNPANFYNTVGSANNTTDANINF